MKILSIHEDQINFDNGYYMFCDYTPSCCEYNYADFSYIENYNIFPHSKAKSIYDLEFDPENIHLTNDEEHEGFTFSDKQGNKIFVPCYSAQNGYYSNDVNIYYCNNEGNTIEQIVSYGEVIEPYYN